MLLEGWNNLQNHYYKHAVLSFGKQRPFSNLQLPKESKFKSCG